MDLNLIAMNFSMITSEEVSKPSTQLMSIYNPDPVAKEEVLRQYKDCFEGVGCFQGEYHMTIDPAVPLVVHPSRAPEALKEPLMKELDSLVEQGILAKVTDWVNSLECVTKSTGALRLCLDPEELNCAIKRPHYFTPTLEDILPALNGAKCFLYSMHAVVPGISSLIKRVCTTFNSPFGSFLTWHLWSLTKKTSDCLESRASVTSKSNQESRCGSYLTAVL